MPSACNIHVTRFVDIDT